MKVNVNKAPLEELLLLPLDLSKAQAVVAERERREGFDTLDSFLDFLVERGIQPHVYAELRHEVVIEHIVGESARIIDF